MENTPEPKEIIDDYWRHWLFPAENQTPDPEKEHQRRQMKESRVSFNL